MILPVFVAGILMLGILAATGNAQESNNTGNRQHTFLPETEENNAHFAQESNNHPMCLNEHTEKWEPCVVKNSPQKHESSNSPSSQESSKTSQESSKTEQSSRPATTITPQFTVTPKAHMTTTNEQLSNNGMLTQKNPTKEAQSFCSVWVGLSNFGGRKVSMADCPKELAASQDCHQTSGGSWLCVPKQYPTVERAPHTGNLYEMREKVAAERKITAAELGPGWRELLPGEKCSAGNGVTFGYASRASGQTFCLGARENPPATHPGLTAFTSAAGHQGAALTHGGPRALAKTVQKVGGETLAMSKALLGIKGK